MNQIRVKVCSAALAIVVLGVSCSSDGDGDASSPRTEDGLRQTQELFLQAFIDGDLGSTYDYLTAACRDKVSRSEWAGQPSPVEVFENLMDLTIEDVEIGSVEAEVTGESTGRTRASILIDGRPMSGDEPDWTDWTYEDGGWRSNDCEIFEPEPAGVPVE